MPEPGRGEVQVRLSAAGMNPFDWKVIDGAVPDAAALRTATATIMAVLTDLVAQLRRETPPELRWDARVDPGDGSRAIDGGPL